MKNKQWFSFVAIWLVIILVAVGYCGYFLILHEKAQSQQMQSMQESISELSAEIEELSGEIGELSANTGELSAGVEELSKEVKGLSAEGVEWLEDGFNYLAIGNSITMHDVTSYWWNEIGMAASDEEHDYFHLVLKYLENHHDQVMGVPYTFVYWEELSHDRDETLEFLDYYLSTDLDLITVQLGENALDLTTFEKDYVSLLEYLEEKAPHARILVVGDFWNYKDRDELKQSAVQQTRAEYISLEEIADNEEYCCGLGTIVYDKDGNEHVVEHSGVAEHPGDKGMEAIAERIIEVLEE